jgi:hypothetical protein
MMLARPYDDGIVAASMNGARAVPAKLPGREFKPN